MIIELWDPLKAVYVPAVLVSNHSQGKIYFEIHLEKKPIKTIWEIEFRKGTTLYALKIKLYIANNCCVMRCYVDKMSVLCWGQAGLWEVGKLKLLSSDYTILTSL